MGCDLYNFLRGLKPAMVMVLAQTIFAGLNVLLKLATKDGMDLRILVVHRYIFATIFLVPIAFFVERNSRPKLTWMIAFQAFLCGLFGGTMTQILYLSSLKFTSLTFVAGMINLVPAMTYIMAVTLRLEKLGIQTLEGKAKLVGTTICIGGAMVLTFYKGTEINIWSTNINLTRGLGTGASGSSLYSESGNQVLGSLLALGCCFTYTLWLIIQAKINERYPCYLSSTALMCIMVSIQSAIYALCMERNWEEWKLGWNIRLWTVVYAGTLASGLMFTMIAWAVRARGPLFVSVFNPLLLVLVAILGSLLLGEKLHVGSLVGAALIVLGLYPVLWGKGKEMKRISQLISSKSSGEGEQIEVVYTATNPSLPVDIDTTNNNHPSIVFSDDVPHNLATVGHSVSAVVEEEEEKDKMVVRNHQP